MKVCPQCLSGKITVFCHDGLPNINATQPGNYECMAWDGIHGQCKLMPNHYVLNTAGMSYGEAKNKSTVNRELNKGFNV